MGLTSRSFAGACAPAAHLSALAVVVVLGACAGPADAPVPGLQAPAERAAGPTSKGAPAHGQIAVYAAAHQADPTDAAAALAYAHALRAGNARPEALAALDKAAAAKPGNRRLDLERGLLALELGDTGKAEKLLRKARDPKAPDWRVHSGLGAALASGGRQQEAQVEFAKALALAPDQPSVLNNLALSYALDGKAAEAEALLRKAGRSAAGAPQVRENLALVLGLRGKYDEAKTVAKAALPPAKANDNVAYLKHLTGARSAAKAAANGQNTPPVVPARNASASLSAPVYQLGGPPSPDR